MNSTTLDVIVTLHQISAATRARTFFDPFLSMFSAVPFMSPPLSSLAHNFAAPSSPTFACVLLNVTLRLFLELNLVPVIVECNDGVDGVAELWHEQKGVDGIDEIFGGSVQGLVTVRNRMANASMAVDVRMIDRWDEACFWWRHGIASSHLQVLSGGPNIVSVQPRTKTKRFSRERGLVAYLA